MRVYHFLRAEHALDDIRNRRLKVALIDKLNDPFEFLGVASKDPKTRTRYRKLKAGFASYMGLLCFSENWRNPVQWSHYAEHHRGICLGFEISANADLRKVRYLRNRLRPQQRSMKAFGDAAKKHTIDILTTKFRHWEYEQEHRLFVSLQDRDELTGFYWYDFSDDVRLCEVIIGSCCDITRAPILEALGELANKVRIRNARLAFRTFGVVTQNDPRRQQ